MKQYELVPQNGRKSFYGKVKVLVEDDGTETLFSYESAIIKRYPDGELEPLYTGDKYGSTTASHVYSFCGLRKADYRKLLKEKKGVTIK